MISQELTKTEPDVSRSLEVLTSGCVPCADVEVNGLLQMYPAFYEQPPQTLIDLMPCGFHKLAVSLCLGVGLVLSVSNRRLLTGGFLEV